jgi:orotate phosphoribosyltransferase
MATDDRTKLLKLLAAYAYDHKPNGYTLASGKVSDEYLDCRMALSHAAALPSVGNLFMVHMDPRVVAIGGLTMGADPIAISTSSASLASAGKPLRWFSVRKNAKEHGAKKMVEGDVKPGDPVAVVDDVVTRGGSTLEAVEKCREHGLNVVQIVVLVDREEDGGLQKIKDVVGPGVPVLAMFTKSEVRRAWDAHRQKSPPV